MNKIHEMDGKFGELVPCISKSSGLLGLDGVPVEISLSKLVVCCGSFNLTHLDLILRLFFLSLLCQGSFY